MNCISWQHAICFSWWTIALSMALSECSIPQLLNSANWYTPATLVISEMLPKLTYDFALPWQSLPFYPWAQGWATLKPSWLSFLFSPSRKYTSYVATIRHWLAVQHPVVLGFPPRGFLSGFNPIFRFSIIEAPSSGASVMPTAGPCVRNGKWSCRLRSSHRQPLPASGIRSGPFPIRQYSAGWGWNQHSGHNGFLRHHLVTSLLLLTCFFSCFW